MARTVEVMAMAARELTAAAPVISVVVELGTRTVTGRIPETAALRAQLNQRHHFGERGIEYILVGPQPLETHTLGANVSAVTVRQGGYYAHKNVGATHARGRYVAFWDSDCRPAPDYLERAVAMLDAAPELPGVAGVTRYDGAGWLPTLNTILSFGQLFHGGASLRGEVALAHNVVIRKSAFPAKPFMAHTARFGGDQALTLHAARLPTPLRLDAGLRIWHEDPSFSPTALLERHLRDCFGFAPASAPRSATRFAVRALAAVPLMAWRRCQRLLRFGPHLGWRWPRAIAALPVVLLYALLDGCAVAAVVTVPALRRRWLHYQFGAGAHRWLLRGGPSPGRPERPRPANARAGPSGKARAVG